MYVPSEKKKCIIRNASFIYSLIVDNITISFNGSSSADYFEKHFKNLGYEVERQESKEEDFFADYKEIDQKRYQLMFTHETSMKILNDKALEDALVSILESEKNKQLPLPFLQIILEARMNLEFPFNSHAFRKRIFKLCTGESKIFIKKKAAIPYHKNPTILSLSRSEHKPVSNSEMNTNLFQKDLVKK